MTTMTATVATLKGSEVKISDENLEEFRMTIRGDVLTPHDVGMRRSARRSTRCIRANRRWSCGPQAPRT
jgi:hypothetical protein